MRKNLFFTSDPVKSQKYFQYFLFSILFLFFMRYENLFHFCKNLQVLMRNSCTSSTVNSNEIQHLFKEDQPVAFVWAWILASKLVSGCSVQYSASGSYRPMPIFHWTKCALTFLIKTYITYIRKMHLNLHFTQYSKLQKLPKNNKDTFRSFDFFSNGTYQRIKLGYIGWKFRAWELSERTLM